MSTTPEAGKLAETNNVRFSQGTKTPENTIIWTPATYKEAQAAIKAVIADRRAALENPEDKKKAGGFVQDGKNSFWFIRNMTEAEKTSIVAAAGKDLELGKEGRVARAAEAKVEKEAKAEAAKAGKAERLAERDASRVLIEVGAVDIGGAVEKDGVKHEVAHIGEGFEKDGKTVAYAYFGELGAKMAAEKAAKAPEAAPAPEPEEEMAPSM